MAQPDPVRKHQQAGKILCKKIFPLLRSSAIIVAQPDPVALNLQPALPSEANLDWGFGLNRTRAAVDELKKRAGKTILQTFYLCSHRFGPTNPRLSTQR